MKNTGITYTSAERSPVILSEMAEILQKRLLLPHHRQ